MLSNTVSFIPILLLSAEIFEIEESVRLQGGIIHPCGSNQSISRPKYDRMRKFFIFPETRQEMLSNAVSFIMILLLSAEIFEIKDFSTKV